MCSAAALLDRHAAERAGGAPVLSLIVGSSEAARAAWASWAASHACLTLLTNGEDIRTTLDDLLAQLPWTRSVAAARARFARAAGTTVESLDAALDARSGDELWQWVVDVAGLDDHVLTSGWLLCMMRDTGSRADVMTAAPIRGERLLSIMCDLAAPIGVLLHNATPTSTWLSRALTTGYSLVSCMPRHAVGVAAPDDLIAEIVADTPSSAVRSIARQGIVMLASQERVPHEGRARSRAEQRLYDAMLRDRRTAGRFTLNARIPLGERELEIDLLAAGARLAVEIDGWYHFREPDGYRRDRAKDITLQNAGYFVMRFLAEDVDDRLELVVDEIAVGLAARNNTVGT